MKVQKREHRGPGREGRAAFPGGGVGSREESPPENGIPVFLQIFQTVIAAIFVLIKMQSFFLFLFFSVLRPLRIYPENSHSSQPENT